MAQAANRRRADRESGEIGENNAQHKTSSTKRDTAAQGRTSSFLPAQNPSTSEQIRPHPSNTEQHGPEPG
jgi:hypothetical protein